MTELRAAKSETCSLCIIGAGIAGMNALYAASRYLTKSDRVVLVDRLPRSGGMWNEVYDYVRLHQPHPMFTAGDIGWTIDQDPAYLAKKPEILDHFNHCMARLSEQLNIDVYYGHEYVEHDEVAGDHGTYQAHVRCRPIGGGDDIVFETPRCIKAFGFRIPKNDRLRFSSAAVNSLSPDLDDLTADEVRQASTPFFIIGGGKTGMDTAHTIIREMPDREVNLVVGKGTIFFNRSQGFPRGIKRWWQGQMSLDGFCDTALHFNGDNENDTFEYFRTNYGTGLNDKCGQYVFGLLSEDENNAIRDGANEVVMDYMTDVVDRNDGVEMQFRRRDPMSIAPGSYVVNCTGYVMREEYPYEPYVSKHGTVISIQPTSSIHFLSTFGSYFLSHLFLSGALPNVPLYEVDYQSLNHRNKLVMPFAAMSQVMYNMGLILGALPNSVMAECGLDFDRWYPLPRRLWSYMKLRRNYAEKAAHFRHSLDRVRERFDVRCGLLSYE